MGRTFIGSVLVAWSFIVIPANLGLPGYEADLLFGFFMLVFGISLIVAGINRIQREARSEGSAGQPSPGPTVGSSGSQPPASPTPSPMPAMGKILGGIASGVVTGLITGGIQRVLGI